MTEEPGGHTVDLTTYQNVASRAGLVWVRVPPATDRPLWTVWHDEALHAVVGGAEQPDPFGDLPLPVVVTVPSKDTGAALLRTTAEAVLVPPGTARWVAATAALRTARLNVSVQVDLPEIWATDSTVVRLDPAGDISRRDGEGNVPVRVDIGAVRPRTWRRMRSHLRARRGGPERSSGLTS